MALPQRAEDLQDDPAIRERANRIMRRSEPRLTGRRMTTAGSSTTRTTRDTGRHNQADAP
ncbi:UNVERIFIED_ORG: hypothetical protein FHR35_002001 [Microbispora rosea subsp. rosea]